MSYKNHKKYFIAAMTVLLVLLLGLMLSGCGQLGPLYLKESDIRDPDLKECAQ